MNDDPFASWAFTLVFTALGILSLVWLVSDRRRPLQVVNNLLHLLMTAAMVAMSWTTPTQGLAAAQLLVFGGGAVWFGVLAALRAAGRIRRRAVGDHGPWQLLAHAVMMLAMVWMVAAMGSAAEGPAGHSHQGLASGTAVSGVAATAALAVAGALLIAELIDCVGSSGGWRRHAGDLAGGAAMSLGTAAMCWAMLA
ncbi:MAG: DUF5134 domain-containing protein [Propionibacteriaceae bacterium]|nr:DUF5134 domain-containing protein [Propionibacteriaceae bacterium]